jgi:hypothetical protein
MSADKVVVTEIAHRPELVKLKAMSKWGMALAYIRIRCGGILRPRIHQSHVQTCHS